MTRYLLDTNVFIDMVANPDILNQDVWAIIDDYDNMLCVSAETLRELIINFNTNGIVSRIWKNADEAITALINEYGIVVLPLKQEHYQTYARLEINTAEGHKDPSDHVIIAHALTEHLPLISRDQRFAFYKRQGLDLIYSKR